MSLNYQLTEGFLSLYKGKIVHHPGAGSNDFELSILAMTWWSKNCILSQLTFSVNNVQSISQFSTILHPELQATCCYIQTRSQMQALVQKFSHVFRGSAVLLTWTKTIITFVLKVLVQYVWPHKMYVCIFIIALTLKYLMTL